MEKVIINSYEEFEKLVGQQIGVSDYVELSQACVWWQSYIRWQICVVWRKQRLSLQLK